MLTVLQGRLSALEESKDRFNLYCVLGSLASVCTQYDDVERVLMRSAESAVEQELKLAAVRLAAAMMAQAGRDLDEVDVAIHQSHILDLI